MRSRHGDLLEDVGRATRQQELLLALKQKLDTREIFVHLEEIATYLQGSVLTGLSMQQVLELASYARGGKFARFYPDGARFTRVWLRNGDQFT